MKHVRWHSQRRRVLIDTHDLRFGLFYVRAPHGGAWLHLPCIVIDLSRRERAA